MRFVKYEVALMTLAQINSNILQVCTTQEDKEFQLAKFQTAIAKIGEQSFENPITKTRVVPRESIRCEIRDLFSNKDFTIKYSK